MTLTNQICHNNEQCQPIILIPSYPYNSIHTHNKSCDIIPANCGLISFSPQHLIRVFAVYKPKGFCPVCSFPPIGLVNSSFSLLLPLILSELDLPLPKGWATPPTRLPTGESPLFRALPTGSPRGERRPKGNEYVSLTDAVRHPRLAIILPGRRRRGESGMEG